MRQAKYYLLLTFILISLLTSAQTEIDVLKRELKNTADSNKIPILLELSEKYSSTDNYEKAYAYLKEYINVHDSIQKAKINNPHKQTIEKLSQNNIQQNHVISQLKLYRNILLVSIFVIFIFLILFFFTLRNKIKTNKKLSAQNENIKRKNEEIKKHTQRLSKINKELEKLSIVASKTDNAIIIANPNGEIEWLNDGFTQLYGYTLDDFYTSKGKTIIESSSNPDIKEILGKTLHDKKSQIYESEVISKSGKKYKTQTTLTPIINEHNEITQLIAIDTDITKLKQVEEELHTLLVTKDKFFSIIAHDLKNPFNSLMGLSQLLYHGYKRMSPEKVHHFHKSFYQISKNGYELLVNLLEWSRSQMGKIKFNPEEQNLYAITEETFSLYNAKANQKQITLNNSLSKDSQAIADKNMLKTIFRNIVSNALKFTETGGAIEVSEIRDKEFTEISIKDTGVGIDPENINKLFNLDENYTTSGTEEETGTGLGLILCKEFVEKHGGKIRVESKVGVGSKFIFTLPTKK